MIWQFGQDTVGKVSELEHVTGNWKNRRLRRTCKEVMIMSAQTSNEKKSRYRMQQYQQLLQNATIRIRIRIRALYTVSQKTPTQSLANVDRF